MNGFIGQAPSAKFILLASSNDSLLPTKRDMTDFFPNHQMNIYKAWGHFSTNFDDIQIYIKVKQLGVASHVGYGLGNGHVSISHAIRLNNQAKRNSFFDLKYGGMVIDYLHLTPKSLKDLSVLLHQIREMNACIDSVLGCKSDLENAKKKATALQLLDQKILCPDITAINTLFDHYGDQARNQLENRIDQWRQSVIWR